MAPAEKLVVCVGLLLLAACLAGLFVRGRQGLCVSFTLYLGAVLLSDTLVLGWPRQFKTWDFWVLKESVHNLLKFGIALELTVRTFRSFPAARKTAAGLVLAVLVLTWLSVGPRPQLEAARTKELALGLQPYVLAGTLWLFIAISALILWYRLPVTPLHKALLLGFVPYLLVFTVAINLLRSFGGDVRAFAGYLKNVAYQILLAYWTYAAWRRWPPRPSAAASRGAASPPAA
jgi:hypothetical protein